jgi:NAD(P)-dependent dehydrogenase (short-subunit alcohol dehydrogenase family)
MFRCFDDHREPQSGRLSLFGKIEQAQSRITGSRRVVSDTFHQEVSMQVNCAGKVVLVAGGTGGLGRGVSLAFLSEGATVITTYRDEKGFAALQSAAVNHAVRLEGSQADVTDESAVTALIDSLTAKHGRIDAVVNTIGGYAGGLKLWELEPKIFERMLDLNLRTGFVLARCAIPAMLKRGSGALINVAAKAAFDHAAGASAYAASKAAAVALMDSLAADLKGTGVRVNSILPSIIDTEVNRSAMPGAAFDKWPKPEEIAQVILFLASDQARVVHGASVPVYGQS